MSSEIFVKDLRVVFNAYGTEVRAIDEICLRIQPGEWVMLGGQNGSGKSTLLRVLAGAIPPSSGKCLLGDRDILKCNQGTRSQMVYYVTQNPTAGTAGSLSVRETLMLADRSSTRGRQAIDRYKSLLSEVGLEGSLNRMVEELSGGERQMLTILVAVARRPDVVLLDEPDAALDLWRATKLNEALKLISQNGQTIIMASHRVSCLTALGTRTIILKAGQVVFDQKGRRDSSEVQGLLAKPDLR